VTKNDPQVFVWNWFWNCATDEGIPAVPTPPPGATTIVLNWHWDCADPPPPLDVAKTTVCTSCNIAISVRVGSPGDAGDVTQTIANEAASATANMQADLQQTGQAVFAPAIVVPLPSVPSVPGVPSLPVLPSMSWPAPPVRAVAVALHAQAGTPFEAEDPPRLGAPPGFGAPASSGSSAGGVAGRSTPLRATVTAGLPSPQRSSAGRAEGSRSSAAPRRPARTPAPPGAPSEPTPFVLAAGAPASHGDGPGAVAAFASALTLAFLYAIYSALRTGPDVPPTRRSGANPHPPG
jgi:hypothetical protein